jgi:hypothetical protein
MLKMKNLLSIFILLLAVIVISCQKESTVSLLGMWKVKTIAEKQNGLTIWSYNGVSADYINFKTNGTAEISVDSSFEVVPYTIVGNIAKIDGDDWNIQNLTKSTVTLAHSETIGTNSYASIYYLER